MKKLIEFNSSLRFLLTDIDDTLTDEGQLGGPAYQALWDLTEQGIQVIPITGRPAGWCEMIARQWPVAGIVGENGGFYFRYHNKKMNRYFFYDKKIQEQNRQRLDQLKEKILKEVPGCQLASDQFCRLMDLAIDFCEDVPALPDSEVQKIVALFEAAGAQAKISSIHVNGWFGDYNKVTMTLRMLSQEFGLSEADAKKVVGFSGDSPNDEPMFAHFPHSFGVANLQKFASNLKVKPTYLAEKKGGAGFVQIAQAVIKAKDKKKA